MRLIDTHTHLFLEEFNSDRDEAIKRAIEKNVRGFILPNVDSATIAPLLELSDAFPANCFPLIGLHPTSVKNDFEKELVTVRASLAKRKFYGIGEIGMDLYWDKTFREQQEIALEQQLKLAAEIDLPVVIHSRNALDEIFQVIDKSAIQGLKGIFHCFPGNKKQAEQAIEMGFKIGIGGIVTFKNSGTDRLVSQLDLKHIVLETDSPYLAPVPFRGKRNESSYLTYIAEKIAEIQCVPIGKVAEITTNNAVELFQIPVV